MKLVMSLAAVLALAACATPRDVVILPEDGEV